MAKKKAKKPVKKAGKKKPAKKAAKKTAKKSSKNPPAKKKASKKPAAPAKRVTTVNVYLNFKGNCEEAFNFYKSVFGGKFDYVGRFNEMPADPNKPLPAEAGNKIMHISLPVSKETILMGSDTVEGFGPPFQAGNNFSISINGSSKSEADRLFNGLSAGGHVIMPMNNTFWGAYFGMFADKYGINWMVNFDTKTGK